ncbi:MAG: glycosyltransferase family 4 protein [bacterium]
MPVRSFFVGRRPSEKGAVKILFRFVLDYFHFVQCIRKHNIQVVHINPSFDMKSYIRDGLLVRLAKIQGVKAVVFFHGWQKPFQEKMETHYLWTFQWMFGRADAFIVLSSEVMNTLRRWQITQPIYRETTVVDDAYLEGFEWPTLLAGRERSPAWRILFLSRIIRGKGIYETVQAFARLQKTYPAMELIVAGDGPELEAVKSFVVSEQIPRVSFPGYIKGDEKRELLAGVHVYILPSYTEGMPVSVVEAMAFGLPIVTRPVGGLADLIRNEVHGFMTPSLDPAEFAGFLERLYREKDLYRSISRNNWDHARTHFLSSSAAARLESVYHSLMDTSTR